VSNSSEGAPEGQSPDMRPEGAPTAGSVGPPPEVWKSRHCQMHFPDISGHYKL